MAALSDDDKRFAELIREGFGVDVTSPAPKQGEAFPQLPTERPSFVIPETEGVTGPAASQSFFDFDEAFARADGNPDDMDAFHAPNPEPMLRLHSPLQWLGMVCLVFSVTLLVLTLFGLALPANVVLADILVIVGSIAMIWRGTPVKRPRFDDYDDGARL
jgi:hypothetical protein